jgi:chitodextrinase
MHLNGPLVCGLLALALLTVLTITDVPITYATDGAQPDTIPPTAPANPAATVVSGSQIHLAWNASIDNVGITGYAVERCAGAGCATFARIATTSDTSYSDAGLAADTSYSYRIRARDAAGNFSPYSNNATCVATTSRAAIFVLK